MQSQQRYLRPSTQLFGVPIESAGNGHEVTETHEQICGLMEHYDPASRSELQATLSNLLQERPDACVMAIIKFIDQDREPSSPAGEFLARELLTRGLLSHLICEGAFQDLEQAVRVAGRVASITPTLNVDLLRTVWSSGLSSKRPAALRVLSVVENLDSLSRTLPMLVQMVRASDNVVRSKAALLASRAQADGRMVREQLKDPDPRVRANALEALWGISKSGAVQSFRLAANSPDEHHRVVVNAIMGLYLAGFQDEAMTRLRQLAAGPCPRLHAASEWALGYLSRIEADPLGR